MPARLPRRLRTEASTSVWAPEHSHIPISRQTPFPAGGELPRKYAECMDPFVSLTLAAAMTKTIKLGTGVCLVVQRDPIQTAKLVASLDQVSQGRFLFGIGGGWNAEEMADHGTTDFKGRWKLVRERVEAMKAIWTQENAGVSWLAGRRSDPCSPGPNRCKRRIHRSSLAVRSPMARGGRSPTATDGCRMAPARITATSASSCRSSSKWRSEAGRDPASLPVTLFGIPADIDRLRYYRDAGVARVVVSLTPPTRTEVLPRLDQWADLMRQLAAG